MNRSRVLMGIAALSAVVLACGLSAWKAVAVDNPPKLPRMGIGSTVSQGHQKVSFASPLQLPDEAMVYRVKTTPVTEQRMRELIALFNMPDPDTAPAESQGGKPAGRSSGGIKISRNGTSGSYNIPDKHHSLYVRDDGVIVYSSLAPSRVQAPSEEQSIAKSFLGRSGLIPPGAKLQLLGVGGTGVEFERDGELVDIMEERIPTFWIIRGKGTLERSIVDVSVCAGGRISGLVLCMRDIEPYMKYPLKSEAEVAADLKAGKATHSEGAYLGGEVTIESCRLAYTEPIHLARPKYIQPTLYLVGKTTRKGKTKPIVSRVAAVKSEYTVEKSTAKDRQPN